MQAATSRWAYEEIKASGYIGERQAVILAVFVSAYPGAITATSVVKKMGRGVSENVRNRITELEQMGFLEKAGETRCEATTRVVSLYKWTGRKQPLPHRMEFVTCEHCEGKGKVMKKVYHTEAEDYTRKDLFQ